MATRASVRGTCLLLTSCLVIAGCGDDAGDKEPVTLGSALGWSDPFSDDAREKQAQELLADCMAAEGWEYVPINSPYAGIIDVHDEDYELEQIRLMGFGVAIQYLNGGQGVSIGDDEAYVDPNADYFASLTPDEQRAYNKSLYGVEELSTSFDSSSAAISYFDPSTGTSGNIMSVPGGCQQEYIEFRFGDVAQTAEQIDLATQYYEAIREAVKADPRTIALDGKWSECMHDAGFDYSDRYQFTRDAIDDFTARAEQIVPPGFQADLFAGMSAQERDDFWIEATEDDWAKLEERYAASIDPQLKRDLEALFAEEVDVAMAEHQCSKALEAEADEIATEVEARYVEDHQDEIAALALSLAQEN